jgi:hypothetical protein
MAPEFLREKAARFRGMAETVDREASKLRYLTMANDFEARAKTADELIVPTPDEALNVNPGRRTAKVLKAGPLALNVVSKILCFVAAIMLFAWLADGAIPS